MSDQVETIKEQQTQESWQKDQDRITVLEQEVTLLRQVADAAAFACIDLASNLSSAHEEYMRGDIARGAYEYVLMRQTSLLIALHKAGYTEKHKLFDCPVKPNSGEKEIES